MTTHDRLARLAQECYGEFKSYAKLGAFLGVSRQQAHRICHGLSEPTGSQLVKMQDLLRKAACVLLAWGVVAAPQDAAAAFNKTPVARPGAGGPVVAAQQPFVSPAKAPNTHWRLMNQHNTTTNSRTL